MGGGTGGIAHIVQTVEEGHEVQPGGGKILCRADLETRILGHAVCGCVRAGRVDRARVEVVADKFRVRECLGHHDGRPAMPASDIGHLGPAVELFNDSVESREP